MSSSSSSPKRSPEPQEKPTPHKVFATNLDIEVEPKQLESQLFTMFAKYGNLESVVVKRSYNNRYSFAFIEFKEGEDATQAVKDLNNTPINGKKIKVELQDNARRRKGPDESRPSTNAPRSEACFSCGKTGHFAKNCRENNRERERERERRRSRSQERPKKKSKKRRERSSSSSSRSERRDRKERSRKIKKSKHKSRRHSSSSS